MNLKLLITSVIITILTFDSFCQKNETFQLSGKIKGDYKGFLYLKYNHKIDSAFVKNKSFYFKGKIDFPTEAILVTKNGIMSGYPFYLENNKTILTVEIDKNTTTLTSINGNKTSQILSDLQSHFYEIESDDDFIAKLYKKLDTIISQNPQNQFSGRLLSDVLLEPIFSYQQANSLFNKLDLDTQKMKYIKSIKESLFYLDKIKLGTVIENFELPNSEGEFINTSDFKDKFLLLEFWASWCAPCREQNPYLVDIYNNYKKEGFEIYGVSLDMNNESWIKAIEVDNLNWINTIAENGFNSEIVKSLGIRSLPANFLVDENGKILAMNIKPVELEKFLRNR